MLRGTQAYRKWLALQHNKQDERLALISQVFKITHIPGMPLSCSEYTVIDWVNHHHINMIEFLMPVQQPHNSHHSLQLLLY